MDRALSGLLASPSHRTATAVAASGRGHARAAAGQWARPGRGPAARRPAACTLSAHLLSSPWPPAFPCRRQPCPALLQLRCAASAVATSSANGAGSSADLDANGRQPVSEHGSARDTSADGLVPPTFVKASGRIIASELLGSTCVRVNVLETS